MAKMIIRSEALSRIRHAADILLSDSKLAKLDEGESLQSVHFDPGYGGRVTFSLEPGEYGAGRPDLVIEYDSDSLDELPSGMDIEWSGSVPAPLKAVDHNGRVIPLHVRPQVATRWRTNTYLLPVNTDNGSVPERVAKAAGVTDEQRAAMVAEMARIVAEIAP